MISVPIEKYVKVGEIVLNNCPFNFQDHADFLQIPEKLSLHYFLYITPSSILAALTRYGRFAIRCQKLVLAMLFSFLWETI